MKKHFYCFALAAAVIGVAACSKTETKAEADSGVDSVETVVADSDSVPQPMVEEAPAAEPVNPEEALTLEIVGGSKKHVSESSYSKGTMTVRVTNNSNAEVKGSEYVVAYTEMVEDQDSYGDFVDVAKKRKANGKDVAPGESVEIVIKSKGYSQGMKNPKIKAVK